MLSIIKIAMVTWKKGNIETLKKEGILSRGGAKYVIQDLDGRLVVVTGGSNLFELFILKFEFKAIDRHYSC